MPITEALKTELADQIARKHALFVVGTGVSLAATGGNALASWKGLIADGVERCVDRDLCKPEWAASQKNLLEGDLDDLLGVAEQVSRRLGWKPTDPCDGEWNAWLRKTVGALRASKPELIQAIQGLGAPIATLNYDNLLTEVTGRRPITWKNAERWLPVLHGNDEAILHLHGHWDQPSSVVLGIRSYDEVMGKELAQHLQRVLASLHSLVFIGCSGTVQDPNFSALIGWMRDQLRGAEHSHYLLLRESEPPPIDASLLRQARIVTLRYGAAHADLPLFIRSLASSSSSASPPSGSIEHKDVGRSIKLPAGESSTSNSRSANLASVFSIRAIRVSRQFMVIAGAITAAIATAALLITIYITPAPETSLFSPASGPAGTLQVDVNVDAARVSVDGVQAGIAYKGTPLILKGVAAGQHRVRVEADGYWPQDRALNVSANEWAAAGFTLREQPRAQ